MTAAPGALPPNYTQAMAELSKSFISYGYPDKVKWEERLPQVARLKEGEHVSYVLGEIQQECLRALQVGKTMREVLAAYPPHYIAQLIKDHTIATNREGGLGRAELLKSTQLQVAPGTGGGTAKARRGFFSRLRHPLGGGGGD